MKKTILTGLLSLVAINLFVFVWVLFHYEDTALVEKDCKLVSSGAPAPYVTSEQIKENRTVTEVYLDCPKGNWEL